MCRFFFVTTHATFLKYHVLLFKHNGQVDILIRNGRKCFNAIITSWRRTAYEIKPLNRTTPHSWSPIAWTNKNNNWLVRPLCLATLLRTHFIAHACWIRQPKYSTYMSLSLIYVDKSFRTGQNVANCPKDLRIRSKPLQRHERYYIWYISVWISPILDVGDEHFAKKHLAQNVCAITSHEHH